MQQRGALLPFGEAFIKHYILWMQTYVSPGGERIHNSLSHLTELQDRMRPHTWRPTTEMYHTTMSTYSTGLRRDRTARGCISEQNQKKGSRFVRSPPWVTHMLAKNRAAHTICIHSLSCCHVVEGAGIHQYLLKKTKKKKKHFIVYSTQIWNFEPLGKDKALIGAPFYVITPSVFVIKKLFSWCYLPSHLHFWISCAVKIECNWMRTEGNLTLCTLKPHLTHAP